VIYLQPATASNTNCQNSSKRSVWRIYWVLKYQPDIIPFRQQTILLSWQQAMQPASCDASYTGIYYVAKLWVIIAVDHSPYHKPSCCTDWDSAILNSNITCNSTIWSCAALRGATQLNRLFLDTLNVIQNCIAIWISTQSHSSSLVLAAINNTVLLFLVSSWCNLSVIFQAILQVPNCNSLRRCSANTQSYIRPWSCQPKVLLEWNLFTADGIHPISLRGGIPHSQLVCSLIYLYNKCQCGLE